MKAETLKKSILQYAMQGKLVAQDPNDEPASELLKRIKAEKEQLIKDGKIKKEKPLPPITEDEILYELPKDWEWVKVQDLLYLKSGDTIAQGLEIQNGDLLYLKVGDMNLNIKYVDKSSRSVNSTNINKNSIIPPRSIIFPKRGGAIATNKKQITLKPILVDLNVMAACCPKDLNIEYLYYWFLSFDLSTLNTGTSVPQINNKDIYPLLFPLPPLTEQQRIVEKLEEILPLVEEYGKNEEILSEMNKKLPKQIRQSILQYAVQGKLVEQNPNDEPASELLKRIKAEKEQLIKDGKIKKEKTLQPILEDEIPFQIPKSWQWVKLDDISNIISGNNFLSEDFNTISGAKVIKITNVGVNQFIETDDYLPLEYQNKYPEFLVNKKDILIALTRSYIKEGLKVCICPLEYNQSLLNQRVASIKIFSNEILQAYIYLYLSSKYVLDYVKFESKTMNQPNLSIKSLKNLYVPLPPLAEQQRIVAKVEELMQIVDVLE